MQTSLALFMKFNFVKIEICQVLNTGTFPQWGLEFNFWITSVNELGLLITETNRKVWPLSLLRTVFKTLKTCSRVLDQLTFHCPGPGCHLHGYQNNLVFLKKWSKTVTKQHCKWLLWYVGRFLVDLIFRPSSKNKTSNFNKYYVIITVN